MTKDEKTLKKTIKGCVNEVFSDADKDTKKVIAERMFELVYDIFKYTFTKPSKQLIVSYLVSMRNMYEKELFKHNLNDILESKDE